MHPSSRLVSGYMLVAACLSLALPAVTAGEAPPFVCDFEPRVQVGAIDADSPPGLNEASGLVQSRRNPNIFWSHQDNSYDERLFAIHRNGSYLGTWDLAVTTARDPEDIATGPGPIPGEQYIFLGDVGHNTGVWGDANARDLRVWRVVEPLVDPDQPYSAVANYPGDTITLRFPDAQMLGQRQDVEGLMVDPLSGDIYIVTKRTTPGMVFRAPYPHSTTEPIEMEWVADLPFGGNNQATGADISEDGRLIVVRRYGDGYIWERAPGQSVGEAMSGSYCHVSGLSEVQGEAVTFDTDNTGTFYTVSEGGGTVPIYRFARTVAECQIDADCDDGLFCTGAEPCAADATCQAGSPPACSPQLCSESLDSCVDCLTDDDCVTGSTCQAASGTCQTPATPDPLPVLHGDVWRYWKGSVEPPASWAASGFDDSGWLGGNGGFGYGTDCASSIGTTLGDMQGSYGSVYIRRTIEVPDPLEIDALALTVDHDDGFVAYLNGVEIARSNMNGTPPASGEFAAGDHECSDGDTAQNPPSQFLVDAGLLQSGLNILGVQGHNVNLSSSDFSLIVGLVATTAECLSDSDCDDGIYCNGDETCGESGCESGPEPSCSGEQCSAVLDLCVECLQNSDCSVGEQCDVGSGVCEVPPECEQDSDCSGGGEFPCSINSCNNDGICIQNDPDADIDGIPDCVDNCPTEWNPEQLDHDLDGIGDICETGPKNTHIDHSGHRDAGNGLDPRAVGRR